MRITNHSFLAPTNTNKKGVKTEDKVQTDKVQTDKVNGTKEMSQADEMAAFKKEFYDELSKITNHQTVSNMSVNVSEKAFQEMKADPAYKEKVLSLIKRDCQSSYGTRNCSVSITVGASTEEYRADSWPVGYDSEFHTRSQNSFYKRTSEKTDDAEVLQTRYAENRLQAMKLQQSLNAKRNMDQAEFSKANLAAVRERNIESELKTAIVDENFLSQVKAIREQRPQLEVNEDKMVDPDGRIAAITYVESVVGQYNKAQNTISEYYQEAHQDNLSRGSQADALNYISVKYTPLGLELNALDYRANMSEAERRMSQRQESALLLGGQLTMKDPFALASSGGVLNIEDIDKIAQQAVRDKLDALLAANNYER